MQKHIVHAVLTFPPDLADLIVSQRLVTDELRPDALVRASDVGHLLQDAFHYGSVGSFSIHCTFLSCCGLKRISRASKARKMARKSVSSNNRSRNSSGNKV